jgi:hypothetical protein
MSAATQPVLDGMPVPPVPPVPQSQCDWVLRKACGCPIGVATGAHHRTEDAAWKAFYETWKAIARAAQRGERMELMPHSRYSADVMPFMTRECPHEVSS